MRNVIYILAVFGCIVVVQAEDASGTNNHRPKMIQASRAIEQSWLRELNVRTNTVVVSTNAVRLIPSLGIKESQFGAYYKALLRAVEGRWVSLLEQGDSGQQKAGAVVLEFKLHQDGRVTDMKVLDSTVNKPLCLICEKSVLDPCPFAPWPNAMQQSIGAEPCTLTLAFGFPPDGAAQDRK